MLCRQELQKAETDDRQVDEEKQILENQFKKDKSLIESKKRMLDEMEQKMEQLRGLLEKTRSDMKRLISYCKYLKREKNFKFINCIRCMSEEESRKMQQQAKVVAMENAITQLKQDLKLGQKVLEEGAATFEDIHHKHQKNV